MSSSNQRIENREPNTLNPRDRSGNILKCFNCNFVKHLVNKCPHSKDISNMRCHKCGLLGHLAYNCSEQKGDKVEESSSSPHVKYITLLNSKPHRMKNLIGESFGMAVLWTLDAQNLLQKRCGWMNICRLCQSRIHCRSQKEVMMQHFDLEMEQKGPRPNWSNFQQ